jgi:predicted TIM-barrel fold metal-dependent hydrolase
LKIHPSLARRRVTDDGYRPALELAEELGLVVLVHCGRWTEIAGFAHAVEAAARHPRARFLLAHAGGDTPPNATGAARAVKEGGLENVWFEFSGLREYWVVERNVALLGAGRYLMGSDFPLAHPLMYVGAVRGMALSDAERRAILGDNARALFGAPLRREGA